MKILHLLSACDSGGIEVLCRNIVRKSTHENHIALLFAGGMIADELQDAGTRVVRLYEYGRKERYKQLLKLAQEEQYDAVIVHHEGVGTYSYYLYLRKHFKKSKYIKYLHMSYEEEYMFTGSAIQNLLHKALLGKTMKESDKLIAVSEFVKQSYAAKYPVVNDKTTVIYNGTEIPDANDVPERTELHDPVRLLYVGRLTDVKGIRYLLEAVNLLKEENKNVQLTLVGDGDGRESYEVYVKENNLQDVVRFEGTRNNVAEYYKSNDIFIYPSVWNEAFGISIIEAMSYGMVCIASGVGGVPEIITDGVDGYLTKSANGKSISDAVENCLTEDVSKLGEISEKAREKASEFDIEKTVIKTDMAV